MANIDEKIYNSYPDGFDVVKVTAKTTAGNIIYKNDLYTVTAKGSTGSSLPTAGATVHTATSDIVLVSGDQVLIVGRVGKYRGIAIWKPTFASNLTSVILNGKGIDMSVFNSLVDDGYLFYGEFSRVSIPGTSTNTVIVCYYG